LKRNRYGAGSDARKTVDLSAACGIPWMACLRGPQLGWVMEAKMAVLIGIVAALLVGGTVIFGYAMYLTSGSESERRNFNRQL